MTLELSSAFPQNGMINRCNSHASTETAVTIIYRRLFFVGEKRIWQLLGVSHSHIIKPLSSIVVTSLYFYIAFLRVQESYYSWISGVIDNARTCALVMMHSLMRLLCKCALVIARIFGPTIGSLSRSDLRQREKFVRFHG